MACRRRRSRASFLTALAVPANGSLNAQLTVKSMAYTGSGNHRPAATVTTMVSTARCAAPVQVIAVPKVG